jgi:putative endopeptidase
MKKFLYVCCVFGFLDARSQPDVMKRSYVDVTGIDPSVKPGDNFFRYVNGRWYDTVKIADDQVGIGSYSFLNIPQKKLLQNILDSVSKVQNIPGSIDQKVGDFYASGMDVVAINHRGYEPIRPILAGIDAITDIPSLVKFATVELKTENGSIIGFGVSPDNRNSAINIAHVFQAGIGLPDRDYYFKTDSSTVAIQEAYKKYVSTLFQLTGSDPAAARQRAEIAFNVEKQIAAAHKTRIELRDVNANYNKVAVAVISKTQPNIGWDVVLGNLNALTDSIDMAQPGYYDKLNELLKSIPVNDWKIYLRAATLRNYAQALSKPFVDASFEFTKVLSGQAVQKPRAQIMTDQVDGLLGQALGQLYVKRYFNEEAKQRVLALVNNLQKAFENRINHLDWMSDSTKRKAIEKLYAINKKIGYPDKWRQYQVQIERTKYFENLLSIARDQYQYQLAKLNKPVDRTEWVTTPSTVTAYYNPSFNEIVFPAGILQYPYFDFGADDAINYGGIGMVIGHEMTHAFDDQGAQYDKFGNVKNWWTKEDYEKFRARTQRVVDLYNSFTVLDTLHVKGALTLGENTADNGGIAIAYDAFKMTPEGRDSTIRIDGFTPDQRFYLSIARIWRVKTRDAYMRLYVNTNPHSPAIWRVNGPCMSAAPFYKAFNVQPGDNNYLAEDKRIKIW